MSKRGITDIDGGEIDTIHPRKCKPKHNNNTGSSINGDNDEEDCHPRTTRKSNRPPKARDLYLKETLVRSRLHKSQKGAGKLANEVIESKIDEVRGMHQPGGIHIRESPETLDLREKGYKKFHDIFVSDGWEARIRRTGLGNAWIFCRKELKLRGGKYKPQLNVNYFESYEDIERECQKPDMSILWVLDRAKLSLGLPLEISIPDSSDDEDDKNGTNRKHNSEVPPVPEAAAAAAAVDQDEDLDKKPPAVTHKSRHPSLPRELAAAPAAAAAVDQDGDLDKKPPAVTHKSRRPSLPRELKKKVDAKNSSTERYQVYPGTLVNCPPEWSASRRPLVARKSLDTTASRGVARLPTRTNLSTAAGLKKPPPSQASNSAVPGLKKPPPSQTNSSTTGLKKPPPPQASRTSSNTTSRASIAGPLFQHANDGADGMKKKKKMKRPPSQAILVFKRIATLEAHFDIHYDKNDGRQRKSVADRLAILEKEIFNKEQKGKKWDVRLKDLEDEIGIVN